MKNIFYPVFALALAFAGISADAQNIAPKENFPAGVENITVSKGAELLKVRMEINSYKAKTNQEVLFTPVIKAENGTDSLELPSILLAGRNRYYTHLRDRDIPLDVTMYHAGGNRVIEYSQNVDIQPWMITSRLSVRESVRGCCGTPTREPEETPVIEMDFRPREFQPDFAYVPPVAELEKVRELRGQAYIDFPVNRTEIYPDYRNNPAELRSIMQSIDTVRNDPDCVVKAMSFKGFASPEGPYTNNIRLAKGRTQTLKDYVCAQYNFPKEIITTSFEPEDWEGLLRFMEKSNLENKQQIIDIINSNLEPDPKNTKIQVTYPEQYKFLLQHVYPGLRHSDYRIEYVIRSFSDPEEIKRLIKKEPRKLSLNEFFIAANTLKPGSQEYDEVFETAVRMYPDDPVALLNAANAAMTRNEFSRAQEYLTRAEKTTKPAITETKIPFAAELAYAQGILYARQGMYDQAVESFEKARKGGQPKAEAALMQIEDLRTAKEITYL